MSGALKAIEGVDSVSVSLAEGWAKIVLKPDNKVMLKQIRESIQGRGFAAEDADLKIDGTVAKQEGKVVFSATGLDLVLLLDNHPDAKKKVGDLLKSALGKKVVIDGYMPKAQDEGEADHKQRILFLRDFVVPTN